MKKLIALVLMVISFFCEAQENKKSISFFYGTASAELVSLPPTKGAASYDGKITTTLGINYIKRIKNKLSLETGIHYLHHTYAVSSSSPPFIKYNRKLNLISIPLKWRYEPGKSFFLNGGLLNDITVSKDEEKLYGIGFSIGSGFRFNSPKRIGFYVNPQLNLRNIASLSGRIQLAEANVSFGITYNIK